MLIFGACNTNVDSSYPISCPERKKKELLFFFSVCDTCKEQVDVKYRNVVQLKNISRNF